jgi:aspartyl-tRNA(Asn)/glutamyl-tRNA(Gln) amidotransferase subunit A
MTLHQRTLTELISLVKKGEATPHDVAGDLVTAIRERDQEINAYLDDCGEELLQDARRLTESGDYKSMRLAGIPIAVKDNISVRGKRTTCGSRILEDYVSPYDATVVRKLRRDGALIGGKTNLDEFAMGSSTENSAFMPTRNPWNLGRSPGGSSGGSAAAVASDMAIAALGSDTGGSVRQPASLCGIVGMKPTYGRISRYGLVAFASSLDHIGIFAKCVADSALLLSIACGEDPWDSTSLPGTLPGPELENGLRGLRIGIPRDFLEMGMDDGVRAGFEEFVSRLKREKVAIEDIALPHARYAISCYYIIANAEASSNLARYDGIKFGHRTKRFTDLNTMYTRTRDEGFGDEVKRRILLGTYVLSAGYYDAYYLKAQKVRSLIIKDFDEVFERCDLVLIPTSPTPAFALGERISDPLQMYSADVFTIPVSLAGLPGISIPIGLTEERLPIGAQLIGRPLDEASVLRGAYGAERIVDFKAKPFDSV